MPRAAKVCRVAVGYCQCGCGQKTRIAERNHTVRGMVKGQPLRYVKNHNRVGSRLGPEYIEEDCGYETPCHVWQRRKDKGGYGRLSHEGREWLAHRFYFEQANGPLPEGFEPDHLCRNPSCIRLDHLEAVPKAINVRRGKRVKLTQADVDAIRRSSATNASLADQYGVHETHVLRIRRFERWKPVA